MFDVGVVPVHATEGTNGIGHKLPSSPMICGDNALRKKWI